MFLSCPVRRQSQQNLFTYSSRMLIVLYSILEPDPHRPESSGGGLAATAGRIRYKSDLPGYT